MTAQAFGPYFDLLLSIALGMARIYPVAYLVPVFCFQHLRGLPRHAVVFALGMLPAPGIRQALIDAQVNWLSLAGLMFKELVLGFLLGVLLALGMQMVAPMTISLPLKLLIFVLVQGWTQLLDSLFYSYL